MEVFLFAYWNYPINYLPDEIENMPSFKTLLRIAGVALATVAVANRIPAVKKLMDG